MDKDMHYYLNCCEMKAGKIRIGESKQLQTHENLLSSNNVEWKSRTLKIIKFRKNPKILTLSDVLPSSYVSRDADGMANSVDPDQTAP